MVVVFAVKYCPLKKKSRIKKKKKQGYENFTPYLSFLNGILAKSLTLDALR